MNENPVSKKKNHGAAPVFFPYKHHGAAPVCGLKTLESKAHVVHVQSNL